MSASYQEKRDRWPHVMEAQRVRLLARQAAHRRLASLHLLEFDVLYDEELAKRGTTRGKPGRPRTAKREAS